MSLYRGRLDNIVIWAVGLYIRHSYSVHYPGMVLFPSASNLRLKLLIFSKINTYCVFLLGSFLRI